jgi:spoIIIJ-associated protein
MTHSQEFHASTVEEALQKASASLGVPADDLSYEVLDTGSEGFLGIGARDARITVQVPVPERAPTAASASEEPAVVEHRETEQIESSETPADSLSEILAESDESDDVAAPEELLGEIRELVTSIVDAMGFKARVDVYDANGFVAVDVVSDSTALFIGQKGETIDALQYLVNAAVYRKRPFVKRIVLDAEGYRQRRVEAIQGIAHRTARRAVRERRPLELPPMSPAERRIVHLFLQDNPKVTTASEGSGNNRRVRISPT